MMKNKIDIGVFVKKAFDSGKQPQQPDKKVFDRIQTTLDQPKTSKKKIIFWLSLSVLVIGSVTYLFLDTISTRLPSGNENNTVITYSIEDSNELSAGELIGPILFSDLYPKNEDALTPDHTSVYYSIILDTTQTNLTDTTPYDVKTNKGNTNYTIDKLFKQKTIYYYYRSSDSLRIETTDKRVIDSILSIENSQKSNDKSL